MTGETLFPHSKKIRSLSVELFLGFHENYLLMPTAMLILGRIAQLRV